MTLTAWGVALLGAFMIGLNKAGIKGISLFFVILMVFVFGAKASVGIVVPLLIAGDIFAIVYYHKHAQWPYVWKLLPFIVLGIVLGTLVGKDLSDTYFQVAIAAILILSAGVMYWLIQRTAETVPSHPLYSAGAGVLVGVTTMVGNLAGTFSDIYFLSMRFPKEHFIGTTAWLFFMVNVIKLPFHIFIWETITLDSLWTDLKLLPAVVLGLGAGIAIIARIENRSFQRIIFICTLAGGLLMLVRSF